MICSYLNVPANIICLIIISLLASFFTPAWLKVFPLSLSKIATLQDSRILQSILAVPNYTVVRIVSISLLILLMAVSFPKFFGTIPRNLTTLITLMFHSILRSQAISKYVYFFSLSCNFAFSFFFKILLLIALPSRLYM